MRIRASEEGVKVVAPAKPLETRFPPASEAPPKASPLPPPLESGQRVAVSNPPATPRAEGGATAPSGKPPPPHVGRSGVRPPPQREPLDAPAAAPATPAKVKVSEGRGQPAPEARVVEPSSPGGDAHPGTAASPATPREAPHIGTDAGRLSALQTAIGIILLTFVAELFAGVAGNSLALFSDAGHTFMDLFSYGIAYAAVTMSQRKSSERETFGGHRAEIVAAFVSGILLLIVVAVIYLEAFGRLAAPEPVDLSFMLTVPLLAIGANLYLAHRFKEARDLNMRGARMHVLSDLLSAIGVLAGGVLILATGNVVFDPLVSFFIGFLILRGAIGLLRESSEILLERTPAHVRMDDVMKRLRDVPGVAGVHAVHAWSLCSTVHALSAHVVSASKDPEDAERLGVAIRAKVEREFGIHFTTIQIEREGCGADQHPTVVHGVAESVSQAHSHA